MLTTYSSSSRDLKPNPSSLKRKSKSGNRSRSPKVPLRRSNQSYQSKEHDIGIFVFRRDLRIKDNHGLEELYRRCKNIVPVFFLDKHQIEKTQQNKSYYNNAVVQFMCESLDSLNSQIQEASSKKEHLRVFYGEPWMSLKDVLQAIHMKNPRWSVAVGWNADYSPYSVDRDQKMKDVCMRYGNVPVYETHTDFTLHPWSVLLKPNGDPFRQFGAFYKQVSKVKVTPPTDIMSYLNMFGNIRELSNAWDRFEFKNKLTLFYTNDKVRFFTGGRIRALRRLDALYLHAEYNENRDNLSHNTTGLSPYLNFGCVSVREAYVEMKKHLGSTSQLIKQLHWRDFYLQALRYIPNANNWRKHIDPRYNRIRWKNDRSEWERLMNAQTGFLLIDAAVMQMKNMNYVHNRMRMMLGVFWTKYLRINTLHPLYGSQVGFSKYLLDAVGPSQNLMNHRWILDFDYPGKKFSAQGVPLSGRPMDVSNKMIKKWDPNGEYVKKWLPHLKNVPLEVLCKWGSKASSEYENIHPKPMFAPQERYLEWIDACRVPF